MKIIVRLSVLLLALALGLVSCNDVSQGKSIKIGVRESVPAFGYKNPISETYSGMEIELAEDLANALGFANAEFVSVTAETREEALKSGGVDFVIATYTVTDERREDFDFSPPYYTNYLRVMVQKSSLFKSISDLKGMTVGVSEGSTSGLFLAKEMASKKIIPSFDIKSFDPKTFDGGVKFKVMETYPELDEALENGEIDAICTDKSILMGYLSDERLMLPEAFSEQEFAVATVKGSEFSEKIKVQLEQWASDETLDSLHSKWDLDN